MLANLDPMVLVLLVVLAVVGHAALLIAAYFVNPVALATSAFFLLAAFSVAPELPYEEMLKYVRTYVSVLIILVGVFAYRAFGYGGATLALLAFVSFYVFAALWSNSPIHGTIFKGLYLTTVLAGVTLAMTIRSTRDLQTSIRLIMLAATAFTCVMLLELVRNPYAITHVGRFGPLGINPNRIGQLSASMIIVCTYVALYDRVKPARLIAYGTGILLVFIILLTGSRGGLGMALVGSFVIATPMIRRPLLAAGILGFVLGSLYLISRQVAVRTPGRITQATFETREGMWTQALTHFSEAPFVGKGWIAAGFRETGSTVNFHSIYMQVLAETGLVGIALMAIMIVSLAVFGIRLYARAARQRGVMLNATYLAAASILAVLAHGVVESGSMMGSTIGALLMGFGAGLIDRLPKIDYSDDPKARTVHDEYWAYDESYANERAYPPEPAGALYAESGHPAPERGTA